jgi:replicative DNA helicase
VTQACYLSAADVLHGWRDDVLSGRPPTLYPAGAGELARLEIGPELVTLFGGAPGAGKTAFAMQLLLDALRLTPTLKAVVCNIEMPPAVLLDRQLARLSGIDLTLIRHRRLTDTHAGRIEQGLHTLDALAERLAFVRPPYTLDNVAATADAVGADPLLLDYIQRIAPAGEHADRRGAVDATMSYLRQFADAGVAVVVVAAVARSRDSKGRSCYAEGLSLASFRESSELEFGADDAFILTPDPDAGDDPDAVLLRHLKSRHGEAADIPLRFERRHQRFTAAGDGPKPADRGKLRAALAELWEQTRPADAGEGGDA